MKRLALMGLALVLAGCTALVQAHDPGKAKLTIRPGDGHQTVAFSTGERGTTATRLTLTGVNLAVNTSACTVVGETQLTCDLGPLPSFTRYELPARGVLVAEADYTRPGGGAYHLATD